MEIRSFTEGAFMAATEYLEQRTATVFEYEVFGNEEDGYEVNNVSQIISFEIQDDESWDSILRKAGARDGIVVDHCASSDSWIELIDEETDIPVGRIVLE